MKTVVVHNAYPDYGGEDTVVANEIALLEKHGVDVVPWIVPTKDSGILNLIRCGLSSTWNPFSRAGLARMLKREQPDLVHFHNTFPLLSPSVFAACHQASVPAVQTIHNYRHLCPAGNLFRDEKPCEECIGRRFPAPALKYRCYRNSRLASLMLSMTLYGQRIRHTFSRDLDAVIALNHFGRNKLIAGGIPAERIHIKPNFTPVLPIPQPASDTPERPLTMCFAGRLSLDKGVAVLLNAWEGLIASTGSRQDTLRLRIAGSGELEGMVTEACSRHSSIEYMGSLSHEETLSMMEQSDCLICPSLWYEGMPMTILEAFSMKTAAIVSDIGGLPELVRDGYNGRLFPPGDVPALESVLSQLLSSREPLEQMGRNAQELHRTHYSEEANYPMLEEIYASTIHRYQADH